LCDLDVVTAEAQLDAFADGNFDGPATVTEVSRDEAAGTITYEITGNYPIGTHAFGVHIEDGCENVLWLEIPFEVVDCKAPHAGMYQRTDCYLDASARRMLCYGYLGNRLHCK
jgi:hypothetical protein